MNADAARRAVQGAPVRARDGLDALAEALTDRYPDIKPIRTGEFLELYPAACTGIRCLAWDVEAGAARWYSGPDHGAHLKPDPAEAAAQIAVIMGSAHA